MANLRLTELAVRALKGSGRYETFWDEVTPGFGIRVGKRTKTWTVMRGRARERVSIGTYPDLSLADARSEAKKLLASPDERPKVIRKTVKEAREEFLEERYVGKSPRTKANVTRLLRRHFKSIETSQLAAIEDWDIKSCLDKLHRTPSEQIHAFRAARCFFRWCVRPPRRYIKHSPMEGYEPPGTDRRRTRTLTDQELKAVWNAATGYPDGVLRLMILWGTRRTETCLLEKRWVADGVMTIPGMQEGDRVTKNGRDLAIPVLPIAQATLDQCEGTDRHFFRSRWGSGHLSPEGLHKAKTAVQARAGVAPFTLHDLRRTFRSNMARMRVPRDVCEALINHAPTALDEIYDRYDRLEEKREALARYEQFIQRLVDPD